MSIPEHGSTPSPSGSGRILVVEDSQDGRAALGRILETQGYTVTSVADGETALAVLRSGQHFDAVLADLMLPDRDGREICLEARRLKPTPLVVLITGWSVEPDPVELKRWGIDLLFLKPLDVARLLASLRVSLGPGRQGS